jgi:hypothetical protein
MVSDRRKLTPPFLETERRTEWVCTKCGKKDVYAGVVEYVNVTEKVDGQRNAPLGG